MLTMAFTRSTATVPAAMTAKAVGEDGAGETTVAVMAAASTRAGAGVDVVVEAAAVVVTWPCGVDRDKRSPRGSLAASGPVDHYLYSLRGIAVIDECSTVI
jgi:hypothetical protein